MCYSVIEVREDVDYQVEFHAGERRMAIIVSLSPNFPLEKPVLRVSPPINHPWCNEHSEITSAPGLLNVSYGKNCTMALQILFYSHSDISPISLFIFYARKVTITFAVCVLVFSTQRSWSCCSGYYQRIQQESTPVVGGYFTWLY